MDALRFVVMVTALMLVAACSSSEDNAEETAYVRDNAVIQLPVNGTWKVVRSPGHERFAYDLVAVNEAHQALRVSRAKHLVGRARVQDAHSWDEPVFAPIDGVVAARNDGWPDREQLHLLKDMWRLVFSRPQLDADDLRPFAGNHVIIQSDSTYVLLAHLRDGSLRVEEGDDVREGQMIARVGNSGMTLEPHLHIQLIDDIDRLPDIAAPPFSVGSYERWTGNGWELITNRPLQKGDVVRSLNGLNDSSS